LLCWLIDLATTSRPVPNHLRLTFVAEKPPPSQVFYQVALMTAEKSGGFSQASLITGRGNLSSFNRSRGIACPDMLFECRSSWLFVVLTVLPRRRYSIGMVRRGDSAPREGIRRVVERRKFQSFKEFKDYRTSNQERLKVFRLEAVSAGFKKAWRKRDYATIITVARKLPENLLQKDPKLVTWYGQAVTRRGDE